ncbi:MAG: HAD-IA family hydrolase, partial [Rhodobacterales bacterium]|nr:HAD-IA family hydrolase [Rhodobacterales bacterium]
MPLQALIFDIDGTLADTEELHRRCFNAAFAEAGLSWHWDPELYTRLLEVAGGGARLRLWVQNHFGDVADQPGNVDLASRLHKRKSELLRAALATGEMPLRPGVESLIRTARDKGLRMSVATGSSRGNLEYLVGATLGGTVGDWFEVYAAGDTVENPKPAPDIYQWVLDTMGLTADQAMAFEDSDVGLASAAGAGLPVIVTPTLYSA